MSANGLCLRATAAAVCLLPCAGSRGVARRAGPQDPLTGPEIRTAIRAIEDHASFPGGAFFPLVTLKELRKADLLAWSPGQPFAREAFANVYEPESDRARPARRSTAA